MTKRVRLHVYSGREDPVWALTDDQVGALQEILGAADVSAAAPLRRRLGYRGFSVLGASPGVEADVGDAAESEGAGGRVVVGVQEAELFLVQSAPAALMDDLGDYLTAAIADVPTESDESGHAQCPPCKATQAPAYNPAYWNNNPSILYNNNCYNYANDKVTGTFAQPGRGSGQMYSQLACAGAGG